MKKIQILVTTGDFQDYLVPNFYHFLKEVEKQAEIIVWHESGNIHEILSDLNIQPDFILVNEYGETNSPFITGLGSISIPYAVLLYDLHYNQVLRKQALQQENPPCIFTLYRDKFKYWYPDFTDRMIWLPHHVNTSIFKDYGLNKDIDCLLMGDVNPKVYPLRDRILNRMNEYPGFVYHPHPGWRKFSEADQDAVYIGERYAREINRAKIFLTCGSIYEYPLLKYFEVLACNTLLLASASSELADLGFIDEIHFVSINDDNFEARVEYYLNHEEERLKIARRGYKMVRNRHSTERRALQFVSQVEQRVHLHNLPGFRLARKYRHV